MLIHVDENIPQGREAFSRFGSVRAFAGRSLRREELSETEILITRSITRVGPGLLDGTPVRFVGTATIGVDHVDLAYLAARGIGFASAPGCNANSVAEYLVAALLELRARGLDWEGRALGIVGLGHVGTAVAAKARALGLEVLANDPPLRERAEAEGRPHGFRPLDDLRRECGILTLHVPLERGGRHPTAGLAGRDFLRGLRPGAIVINTCRGEVLDEAEARSARADGTLGALVLDVFRDEPAISAPTAAAADLVSPHVAGYSIHGKLNGTAMVAAALARFLGRESEWAPAVPVPEHPDIDYTPDFDGRPDLDFVRHCVDRAYAIARDDARLRAALAGPDPARGFDHLRKTYPVRPEFADFRVRGLPGGRMRLANMLAGLGFRG